MSSIRTNSTLGRDAAAFASAGKPISSAQNANINILIICLRQPHHPQPAPEMKQGDVLEPRYGEHPPQSTSCREGSITHQHRSAPHLRLTHGLKLRAEQTRGN